jgi:hypothetical protein
MLSETSALIYQNRSINILNVHEIGTCLGVREEEGIDGV